MRRNFSALCTISEHRPAVELMLKTYVDEKGNFVTANPEDSILKKNSEEIITYSESPRSTCYFEGPGDFTGFQGFGVSYSEDSSYKNLLRNDKTFQGTEFTSNKQSIGDFCLQDEDSNNQDETSQRPNQIEDPALDMAIED